VPTSHNDIKVENCVTCPGCSCEIPLHGTERLPGQFSVQCPNCGHREKYAPAEVHDRKETAKPDYAIREIQFGRKKISVQPKSRLNAWASWLLQ
jgi:hypothetical protein